LNCRDLGAQAEGEFLLVLPGARLLPGRGGGHGLSQAGSLILHQEMSSNSFNFENDLKFWHVQQAARRAEGKCFNSIF